MVMKWRNMLGRWRASAAQSLSSPVEGASPSVVPLQGVDPRGHDSSLFTRGVDLVSQQRLAEAAGCADELRRRGEIFGFFRLTALIAIERGLFDDAEAAFAAAIDKDPDNPSLYFEAGMLALRRNETSDAEYMFSLAVRYEDTHGAAHLALGELLAAQERTELATTHFAAALRVAPGNVQVRRRLADAYRTMGDLAEAIRICQDGLVAEPDDFELHAQLGKYHRDLGDYVAARVHSARAVELRPDDVGAQLSHAQTMLWTGDAERAVALARSVFEANPGHSLARWNLMSMLLQEQQFAQGWPHYEALMVKRLHSTRYGVPGKPWHGEPLAGKRVVIFGEQGLGDEVMFAACIPQILQQTAACIIECSPKLERLYAASFPKVTIHAGRDDESRDWLREFGPIDYEIPCGSLASVFRRTRGDFPNTPYLHVPQQDTARWRNRLDGLGSGLKVGISWRGGSITTGTHARSIPLREWEPILRTPGTSFINLQYTDCAAEVKATMNEVGVSVVTFQEALDDYYETAALVSALDLVVSVCTTIVVVASGLGRPVWVMAPPGVKWPYPRGQRQTPWAPTAQVYWRGAAPGWASVINCVAADLARHRAPTNKPS